MQEIIDKFEKLAECHKDGLLECISAKTDEGIWVNLYNIYFKDLDPNANHRSALKSYIQKNALVKEF